MSCFCVFEKLLFDTYQGIVCVSSSSSEESPAHQPSIVTCGTKAALDTVSNVMKEALEDPSFYHLVDNQGNPVSQEADKSLEF